MNRLERIEGRVQRIEGQVSPNGGSSMNDTVNKIADAVGASEEKSEA